jgi:hypothetical protein
LKSGESATEAPSEGTFELVAVGSPEEGDEDSSSEAGEEAILLMILREEFGVLKWSSFGCGCVARCVWRWEWMQGKHGRTEDGVKSDASRKLGVHETGELCRSGVECPTAL